MQENRIYLLIDSNLLAGYYAPQTLNANSQPAADKITNIIESVKKKCSLHIKLLVPEICVAEAQTVLSKHAILKWKGGPKRKHPKAIHGKTYKAIINRMREDLHGGKLIESIPLQRYHVLAKHLITPIDHNVKLTERELGGTDQLICGMAIWLTRLLGKERFFVITADYRLAKVLEKAQKLTDNQFKTWGICDMAEKAIGFKFSQDIYPSSIYLPTATEKELRAIFACWPLPIKKEKPLGTRRLPQYKEIETLVGLYKNLGTGRDNLPYSQNMALLTKQFNDATGLDLNEALVWKLLITRLKKGGGKLK